MSGRRTPRRATIVQVARLAGVSIKTVSRVTNGEPNVRPEVQQRVVAAIAKLGYHPMHAARGLASRRSRLLALVYDNPSPSYLLRLQSAARQCCQEHGLRLVFHPCDHRDPRLAGELSHLASNLRLEGLILVPPISRDAAVIKALTAAQVPVALLAPGRARRGHITVLLNDEAAAQRLAEHVLQLGHRRIGFVRGHPDHDASRERFAGFEAAMKSAGLAVDPALVVGGDFSFASGRSAGAELLDRRVRPTAIIASNDDMAAGVMAAAHDRRIRIPAELAVCGFDDTPLASMLWPPLTTMHQPISELARAGTRLLIDRLRGEPVPARPAKLHCELIVRASTSAPAPGTRA